MKSTALVQIVIVEVHHRRIGAVTGEQVDSIGPASPEVIEKHPIGHRTLYLPGPAGHRVVGSEGVPQPREPPLEQAQLCLCTSDSLRHCFHLQGFTLYADEDLAGSRGESASHDQQRQSGGCDFRSRGIRFQRTTFPRLGIRRQSEPSKGQRNGRPSGRDWFGADFGGQ